MPLSDKAREVINTDAYTIAKDIYALAKQLSKNVCPSMKSADAVVRIACTAYETAVAQALAHGTAQCDDQRTEALENIRQQLRYLR